MKMSDSDLHLLGLSDEYPRLVDDFDRPACFPSPRSTVHRGVPRSIAMTLTYPERGEPWSPVLLFATLMRFVPVTPYKFMDMSRHPSSASVLASSPTFLRAWTYPLLRHRLLLP